MVILKVGKTSSEHRAAIRDAVSLLQHGRVIAFPTETVYGLGCDPRNTRAVNKIFEIKGRDDNKPVQLIAGSWKQVEAIAEVTTEERRLAKQYWPGPLTLLVKLKKGVRLAPRVSPKRIIGIRITSDPFIQALTRAFGHPIAATSANKSGSKPATSGRGVERAFKEDPKPYFLLDFGVRPRRKPTTVARIRTDGSVEVLRQGGISLS